MFALNSSPESAKLSVEPVNNHRDDLRAYVGMSAVDASEENLTGETARPHLGQDIENLSLAGVKGEGHAVDHSDVMGDIDCDAATVRLSDCGHAGTVPYLADLYILGRR